MKIQTIPTHHPSDELLLDYAAGTAAEPVSMVIASHLAFCARCREEVRELDRLGGVLLEEMTPESMAANSLERMLARIERPDPPVDGVTPAKVYEGNLDIPEPLRSYLNGPLDVLPWRRRGAISELTLLPDMPNHVTRLLWIRAGAAAPRHTHEGNELTLVLRGSFRDDHGHYGCGDVDEADGDVDHRPVAGDDEDCLCLTVTDAPLKLTSPLGRLINPFVKI